jgi:hypothetical protein
MYIPYIYVMVTSLKNEYMLLVLLTPCSTVLLEKLTVSQLAKKFPAFYGNRRYITAFTSVRLLSLSRTKEMYWSYVFYIYRWYYIFLYNDVSLSMAIYCRNMYKITDLCINHNRILFTCWGL